MAKNKSRSLEWGRAKKPKVSNRLGIPHLGEGGDGDIQVRQVSTGARLFARFGSRWLSNVLHGDDINDPNVFTPKAWFNRGVTSANDDSGTVVMNIFLPEFIGDSNILGVNFGISLGANERTYFSLGDTGASAIYDMFVHYNKVNNKIRIELFANGTSIDNKDYTLTVFFK
tara:strand:+ start:3762 stop:4274 length:513 start_codon:yes stop_codon:yes gene_type:complete